jgi:hypothetical protein
MNHAKVWRLLVLLAAAALVLGACRSDSDDESPAETTTHSHDGAEEAMAWDGPEDPTIAVAVSGDPGSGWDIVATITGLTFSDPTIVDHSPGQGHTHVFLDGELVTMSYKSTVHVTDLEPGTHQAMVTLSRNDHMDYSLDGEMVMGMAMFTVPGEVAAPEASFTVMYKGGSVTGIDGSATASFGDVVEITVQSDVADDVHVHGYDRVLHLEAGQPATLTFTADIPGIFEVELETSGVLLFELEVG